MAKGSGLSFDSDPINFFPHKPTVINSFPEDNTNYHHHPPKWKLDSMEATVNHRRSPIPTIQFPVNLNSTDIDDDDQDDHLPAPPPPSDHHQPKRTVMMDEMDFFKGGDAKTAAAAAPHRKVLTETTKLDFDVNTGLHLLTANTSSDQSMVDDGISPNSDDKRAKTEMAVLQADLGRMNAENQRLRDMLHQVTTNYNALQMHLVTLMEQQQQHHHQVDDDDDDRMLEKKEGEEDMRKQTNGMVVTSVPRQFMDLGLGSGTAADADHEPSLSSSEGRSGGGDPVNTLEAVSKELYDHHHHHHNQLYEKKDFGREESPENDNGGSQGWGSNKVQRLNPPPPPPPPAPPKNVDQAATEATMRKARVSVRARSEAPMVY